MKSTLKSHAPHLAIVALLLATLACNAAAGTPTPGFSALETMVAATLQAAPSQASPLPTFAIPTAIPTSTSVAPTMVVPTMVLPTFAAPTPSPIYLPPATPIDFSIGATQLMVPGTLAPGQSVTYVVRALQGQPTVVDVTSPDQNLRLAIFGANGVTLLAASQGSSSWQGTLPSTQDYYFQVTAGSTTQNFTLNLVIAARVQFAAGEIKSTLNGRTVNGFAVTYAAHAQKGQKMDIILTASGDNAALTIWGFSDGEPYARAQNGVRDFSRVLPSTQDYMIQVVPQAGKVVDYSLFIKIR